MSRVPFQLLELNLISALDLAPPSNNLNKNLFKKIKAYAVVWIDPERKLRTRPDLKGNNNPHWNQKFVFRVEDELMDTDTGSVVVEIYAMGWLKDNLIGTVTVLIRDLIPPSVRRERRVVALQVRRHHSGRPQGILSMGVALQDNTMKSMPLCTVLTGSAVGAPDFYAGPADRSKLVRTLSDQTNLSRVNAGEKKRKRAGSVCSVATAAGGGSVVNPNIGDDCRCGYGSAVNGAGAGNGEGEGSVISDLGPSPSVVAIAVAHGLYPLHQGPPPKPGSSVLEDWTVEAESNVEDLQAKMEQWRLDRHQGYQRLGNTSNKRQKKKNSHQRSRSVEGVGGGGDGKFSCFGNMCGCEFAVTYGNGGNKKGRRSSGGSVNGGDSKL